MCERKLHDLEHQQMVLENNLKKFLDLKREFSFLQHEAEESDKVVNEFIKVVKFCYFTQSFRQVSIFETHSASVQTYLQFHISGCCSELFFNIKNEEIFRIFRL